MPDQKQPDPSPSALDIARQIVKDHMKDYSTGDDIAVSLLEESIAAAIESARQTVSSPAAPVEELEHKHANCVKVTNHIIKRLADEYGVHLSLGWADRVLADEHDVPFPALSGDTLDSLRGKLDACERAAAGVSGAAISCQRV